MPENDRLLSLVFCLRSIAALVLVSKEMKGVDGSVLVTLAKRKLL